MVDVAQPSRAPRVNKIAMTDPWQWLALGHQEPNQGNRDDDDQPKPILKPRQSGRSSVHVNPRHCAFPGVTFAMSVSPNIDSRQRNRVAECRTPEIGSGAAIRCTNLPFLSDERANI